VTAEPNCEYIDGNDDELDEDDELDALVEGVVGDEQASANAAAQMVPVRKRMVTSCTDVTRATLRESEAAFLRLP
jgi:hypothetical protein